MEAVQLYASQCFLGEGPYWHAIRNSFFWVDIESGKLFEYPMDKGKVNTWKFEQRITLVVEGKADHLILALDQKIARFNLKTENLEWIASIEDIPGNRLNDGKCDAKGRLWVGSMSKSFDKGAGAFYSLDADLKIQKYLDQITISNGMAWTHDNKTLYYIDSPTQKVNAYHFDLESGNIQFDRNAIDIPNSLGTPDGMCIDVEGKLWIAHYGGSGIYRWDPLTGKLMEKVSLPVPHVTSCAFGGENLDTLLVTTARENLNEAQLRKFPFSGDVFVIQTKTKGYLPNASCF
ncbi:SMP-30/gluconolactonase/LRE family protein [Cecembia lonarensis]|uniref:Gluconolactonase n=1 Tax=Cecembia lonarensis (strain CCUG 58316 / KCTC 22772 / LW9) TaxID=1225176 RepID=K1L132_CECL9|nr:SMP-30/gluconolactonase/LRE family protein [Cecembia lonarensis]EKB50115.1 Gluconolactonase [Cecembia lonarensis LW9]